MGLFSRLFEKRSTSGVRKPADWLSTSLGGGDSTASGISVGPDTALTLSSYYAAIRAIGEDIGKLPLILYRKSKDGGRQRADTLPLFHLLKTEVNPEMSSMAWRETMLLHAIGWGNGYSEISRDGNGKPTALWSIDPTRVSVDRLNGGIIYKVRSDGHNPEIVLQSHDVFHLHGLGFDGLTGYSIATLARESIGSALAMERSGAALFGNGSRPGCVLQHPGELSKLATERLKESWEKTQGGLKNSHRVAVLEEGMTIQPFALANKDSQWIEARNFMVAELARWLRIPPSKIADLSRATFTNSEQESRAYVVDSLMPWARRIELEVQRKLLPSKSPLFAEVMFDALLRPTTKERFESYNLGINGGWLSRNEVRRRENLPPIPSLDAFLEPLNMQPANTPTTQ